MNNTFYGFVTDVSGVFFLVRNRVDPNEAGNTIMTVHRLRQFGRSLHDLDTTKLPPTFPFTYVKCNGIETNLEDNVGYFPVSYNDLQIGVWEEVTPPEGDLVP